MLWGLQLLHETDRQAVIDSVPLGRYGTASDIANACLMLSSELGAYITGAILPVDGGWSQNHCGNLGETLARIAGDERQQAVQAWLCRLATQCRNHAEDRPVTPRIMHITTIW